MNLIFDILKNKNTDSKNVYVIFLVMNAFKLQGRGNDSY
jgi:hypothetical protein